MPLYSFSNPSDENDIVDVILGMNDIHEFILDGVKWNRVFTIPQASVDARLDPFDNKAFIEKTGKNKGTLGDVLDRSKELSEIRAEKRGGKDPVREKHLEQWKKERKGRKVHPSEIHKSVEIVGGE